MRSPLGDRKTIVACSVGLLIIACGRNGPTVDRRPTPAETPALPASLAPTPIALRAGGEVRPPVLVSQVQPQYEYPGAKWEMALLIFSVVVTKDGQVQDVKLLKEPDGVSSHNVQAAMAAVRQFRYSPATLKGKPVDVSMVISLLHVPGRPVA